MYLTSDVLCADGVVLGACLNDEYVTIKKVMMLTVGVLCAGSWSFCVLVCLQTNLCCKMHKSLWIETVTVLNTRTQPVFNTAIKLSKHTAK